MKKKKTIRITGILMLVFTLSFVLAAQCSDGIDNDLDGKIDFPTDNGCDSAQDSTESLKIGYAHGCLGRGEKLLDVFGNIKYQCSGDLCLLCVLMTEAGNYSTLPSRCNNLPQCGFGGAGLGGNTTIDSTPPVFTLLLPTQNNIYTSRSVPVEFSLDERADVYYLDLINGRGRWSRVCSDCFPGNPAYSRQNSFKEGFNELMFRATDTVGNKAYQNISFFVDSKDPRISRSEPRRGFASGDFMVQFKEDNPETLKLYYGDSLNMKEKELDIPNDCYLDRTKYYCDTTVDLDSYDGGTVEYYFTLTDIAGNLDESRSYSLDVDTTFPVINNEDDFWSQGEGRYVKYIYFSINITEENLDEVFYSYVDDRGRLRERRLCSRLDNGICEKRVSFRKGEYDLMINVIDEAGNLIGVPMSFEVDY